MKHAWTSAWFVALTSVTVVLGSAPVAAETPDDEDDEASLSLEVEEVEDASLALTVTNHRLRNLATGLCLSTTAELVPQTKNCLPIAAHRWDIVPLQNGRHLIRSRNPLQQGKCLSIAGETIRSGSFPFMGSCGAPAARRWLIPTPNPRRICVAATNGLSCLQSVSAGSPPKMFPANASAYQLWQDLF
ncbi:RICIN domain-containing protein [Polyangium sp. y55x31]|uniref:RICIN domain-containing protein n=1 Tax=Polyangium sp. y55x31 TaxID=3042688 RepID=UPI00248301F5|nr:RICIN domain-containing protein [Polyangium sp. y55x31]MDI1483452.1 RICIN domain-containing protein [Polyangium sp. y55x31]